MYIPKITSSKYPKILFELSGRIFTRKLRDFQVSDICNVLFSFPSHKDLPFELGWKGRLTSARGKEGKYEKKGEIFAAFSHWMYLIGASYFWSRQVSPPGIVLIKPLPETKRKVQIYNLSFINF